MTMTTAGGAGRGAATRVAAVTAAAAAVLASAYAATAAAVHAAHAPADFPPPYSGCAWVKSLPGGSTDFGPCTATSSGSCAPGKGFVSTHTLACTPPHGVHVRPELLVFLPGGAPANYSLLLATAAGFGFRAIAPTFNNIDAPNSICDGG